MLDSLTGGCVAESDVRFSCDINGLSSGESNGRTVTVRAPASAGTVSLEATAATDLTDPVAASEQTTVFEEDADLAIVKFGPSVVQVNQQFNYTIAVENLDPQDSSGRLLVRDLLPTGVTFVSATSDDFACAAASQEVACSAGFLEPGQVFTVTLAVRAPSTPGEIENVASVSSETLDPNPANDSSEPVITTVGAEPPPLAVDLEVLKTAPAGVRTGETFSYQLTVVNTSVNEALQVELVDPLPPEATFVSASSGCTRVGNTVTCSLQSLAGGESAEVAIVVRAPAVPINLSNTATVTSASVDSDPTNDSDTAETVVATEVADVAISKSAPERVGLGESFDYELTLFNFGPDGAANVRVTDPLPPGVAFVSASQGCTSTGGTVTCELGSLASGASATVIVTVNAVQPGIGVNTATVNSDTLDNEPGNDAASATTEIAEQAGGDATLVVQRGPNPPVNRTIPAGSLDIPALQAQLAASGDDVTLTGLVVDAAGSGNDAFDVAAVKLFADSDGDGRVGGADTLLGSGRFASDDGSLTLTLAQPAVVPAGGSLTLLVAVDLTSILASGPGAPLLSLGALGFGLTALLRRRRLWLVWAVAGMLLVTSCGTLDVAPPPQSASYQLTLSSVTTEALQSEGPATVTGVPVNGALLNVTR